MKRWITIKEAIILAQQDDQDAMIALLKQYQPLIARMIGISIAKEIKEEDIESVLILKMISLIKALDTSRLE